MRIYCAACTLLLLLASTATSAELGTYVLGTAGLKAGTVPPPGLYAISLNFLYRSTDFRDQEGQRVTQLQGQRFRGEAEAFLNISSMTYVSKLKLLEAYYTARIVNTAGIVESETKVGPTEVTQRQSGNFDLYLEPLNLSWHLPRFDLFASYGFYAPVGDSDINNPVTVSQRWSHLISAGMTAYLDAKKTWALSLVPRYEIYHRNREDNVRAGHDALFEWGISRTFTFMHADKKTPLAILDVGPVGYAALQVTDDDGAPPNPTLGRYSTYAAGAEAGVTVPKWHAAKFSVRYEKEFLVHSRPQGQMALLRLSVKF